MTVTVCRVNPGSSKIISKSNTAVASPDCGSTAAEVLPWPPGARTAPPLASRGSAGTASRRRFATGSPVVQILPLSYRGCVLFAEVLPHPHSPLLNCVIIFKQINSIAEFSRPNDEFAVQIPLISLSPENQLMNDTQCFLGEAFRQPCRSPKLPRDTAPPRPQLLPAVGIEVRGQRRPQPPP